MSFLVPWALLLSALIGVPILAHALFRGPVRPLVFPAARFVPHAASTTQKRNRLQDRWLLALRVAMLLALALLAASPFVACSRLSLSRPGGASLCVALVIDDSASMNVVDGSGTSRLELALTAAKQILDSAKPGDSISIVLAGKPARLASPATTRLDEVRATLERITPTDRATDLGLALDLARSSLEQLAQRDARLLVFSDLQGSNDWATPARLEGVSAPLVELRAPFENCALSAGEVHGKTASVEIGCTPGSSLVGRRVRVHVVEREPSPGEAARLGPPLGEVDAREGPLRISLSSEIDAATHLVAELSPSPEHDRLPTDDRSELLQGEAAPVIAVRADPESAGTHTGSSTVFELALHAVDADFRVEPLTVLPDSPQALVRYSALILDDPPGLSPEAQAALRGFFDDGGVALVLLGPNAARAPLGAGFWPFNGQAPSYQATTSPGAAPNSAASLGPGWDTWTELGAKKRAVWTATPQDRPWISWTDGAPLVLSQSQGRGLALVSTLPGSLDQSDFALRPAFLALLSKLLDESRLRKGSHAGSVGESWIFPQGTRVRGPSGPVPPRNLGTTDAAFEPPVEGRYSIESAGSGATTLRYATRPAIEGLTQPGTIGPDGGPRASVEAAPAPLARPLSLILLLLGIGELILRVLSRKKGGAEPGSSPEAPASPIPAA